MASEDSGRPVLSPVPTAAVHLHGESEEAAESFGGGVLSASHRTHNRGEGFELEPLLTNVVGLRDGKAALADVAAGIGLKTVLDPRI